MSDYRNKPQTACFWSRANVFAAGVMTAFLIFMPYRSYGQVTNPEQEFQDCIRVLDQDADVFKDQIWHTSPLPRVVARVVDPMLYGSIIVRWTSHRNEDGSVSYIVMERDPPSDDPYDDPNGFSLVMLRHGTALYLDSVATDAILFDKRSSLGVSDVYTCTHDFLGNSPWAWNGKNWFPLKGNDQ